MLSIGAYQDLHQRMLADPATDYLCWGRLFMTMQSDRRHRQDRRVLFCTFRMSTNCATGSILSLSIRLSLSLILWACPNSVHRKAVWTGCRERIHCRWSLPGNESSLRRILRLLHRFRATLLRLRRPFICLSLRTRPCPPARPNAGRGTA
jgi:hypothetical protein